MTPVDSHCPSCGTIFTGPWCAACGERRLGAKLRGLRHYFDEGWQAVSDVDGRLWKSLWTLLRRPGALTQAWWAGRRRPYLGPIQLFLLISVTFFLLSPFDLFSTPLRFHLHLDFFQHKAQARELVHRRLAPDLDPEVFFSEVAMLRPLRASAAPTAPASHPAVQEKFTRFEAAFDQRSSALARSLIFVMIPMLALGSWLLAALLRVPIEPTRHLVHATHFLATTQAIALLMGAVLHPAWLAKALQALGAGPQVLDMIYSPLFFLLLGAYLVLAARRVWNLAWGRALAHGLGLTLIMLVAWNGYRALLFFLTFYTLESPA